MPVGAAVVDGEAGQDAKDESCIAVDNAVVDCIVDMTGSVVCVEEVTSFVLNVYRCKEKKNF